MSRHACPAGCPFNPWRPESYTDVLAIHDRLDTKVLPRLERDAKAVGRPLDPPCEHGAARQDYFIDRLFQARDDAGRTFFQRWEAQGFDGLSNDERVLFRAHSRMRVRAVEIRTVRDETISEATDLLDPAAPAFPIADRSLAGITGRFSPYLAWMYDLPHYWRMHGLAVPIPDVRDLAPGDVVQAVAAHLGWSVNAEPLNDWLDRHYARCADALSAVPAVMWEETFRRSNLTRTVVLYRLRVPAAKFTRWMDAWPEVERSDTEPELAKNGFGPSWDWLDDPSQLPLGHVTAPAGAPMRGTFSLGAPQVLLTIPMGHAVEPARAAFEARAGDRVEFVGTRADDLGRQTKTVKSVTPRERELVPPEFLARATRLDVRLSRIPLSADGPRDPKQMMREMDRLWLDEALPGLGGLTPRQAAGDAAQRPALVELVKERIRTTDQRQRREGDEQDPVWMARDLGLTELDVPAPEGLYPPPRPCLPDLPLEPLCVQDVEDRIEILLDVPERSSALPDLLDVEAPALCDFLAGVFSEDEVRAENILFDLAATAWFVLFPKRPPARPPAMEVLQDALTARLRRALNQSPSTEELLDRIALSERQPVLVAGLQQLAIEALGLAGQKGEKLMKSALRLTTTLAVLVDELDAIARPPPSQDGR